MAVNKYGVVYRYTNTINGKHYIGQTVQPMCNRHRDHVQSSRYCHKKGYNMPFIKAIRKYGIQSFEREVLFTAFSKEALDWSEIFFIEYYQSMKKDKGYNIKNGGSNGKHTEETKRKIRLANFSEKRKKLYRSEKWRQIGLKNSINLQKPESIRKAALAKKGRKATEAQMVGLKFGHERGVLPEERFRRKITAIKDGIEFMSFGSIKDAASWFNIKPPSISFCLSGRYKTSVGMKWRYVNGS